MIDNLVAKFLTEDEFSTIGDEWNNLLNQSNTNSVFLTHEWLYTWWQTFKGDKIFFSVAVYDNNSLVGIAPLFIEKRYILKMPLLRELKFLGMNKVSPDYLNFIIKQNYNERVIVAILNLLLQHNSKWDVMRLADMPEAAEAFLTNIFSDRFKLQIIKDYGNCPVIVLPERFEDYLSRFKHKRRSALKRDLKLIKKNFNYEYENTRTQEEAQAVMRSLFVLHESRAKAMKRGNAFDSQLLKNFHLNLIKYNFLKLFYIKLNEQIECVLYALIYNNCFYFYQAGFNPNYSKHSLGKIMLFETIRASIELGCKKFDFLKGDEDYKRFWAKDDEKIVTLLVGSKKLKSKIFFSVLNLKKVAKKIYRKLR